MLTPTQNRILNRLRDCRPHSIPELAGELYKGSTDHFSNANNIRVMIHNIRKKLPDIICNSIIHGFDKKGVYYYQLVQIPIANGEH